MRASSSAWLRWASAHSVAFTCRGCGKGTPGVGGRGRSQRGRALGGGWSWELPPGPGAGRRWRGRQARGSPLLGVGRRRGGGGRVVGGTQPVHAGLVGEGQDRQRPAGRCHQQVRGRSLGRAAALLLPPGSGDEVVAQGTQCGFGGVQDVIGDRVDLRRALGCGEGIQVEGEVGRRPRLVGQGVGGAEGLCVASCPPLQVAAGGEVVTGGVNLVGVAADVVVQVEVWVARGDAEVPRGLQWRAVSVLVIGECGEQLWMVRAWRVEGEWRWACPPLPGGRW